MLMKRSGALICGLLVLTVDLFGQDSPRIHELKASPQTVHRNFFDATIKPVLTIHSGDIVRLETASGNPRYFERLGVPKDRIPPELYSAFDGVEGSGRGDHTLNGPIHVTGAEPGDMLEIRTQGSRLGVGLNSQDQSTAGPHPHPWGERIHRIESSQNHSCGS